MRVLGIAGHRHDAAVALAVDGRLVAAAIEGIVAREARRHGPDGSWPDGAAAACLAQADLRPDAIDLVIAVDDGARAGAPAGIDAPVRLIDPLEADAWQALASTGVRSGVLVCSESPPAFAVFDGSRAPIARLGDAQSAAEFHETAREAARTVGLDAVDPLAALDGLGRGTAPETIDPFHDDASWLASWRRWLERQTVADGARLGDAATLNVRVQRTRRAIAATFVSAAAGLIVMKVRDLQQTHGWPVVALGGGWLRHPAISTGVGRALGEAVAIGAIPDASGRALGAALAGGAPLADWPGPDLGPRYADADIKHILDNCRLDYVYEPDLPRLIARVSRLLEQGKVVAWFQGATPFGTTPFGCRSILCDPSSRYARHNVNEYLRRVPLDTVLPIVVAPSAADQCLEERPRPFGSSIVTVRDAWRARLAGALDGHDACVHGLGTDGKAAIHQLLERHFERTGAPALIEVALRSAEEPMASSPRDAIRAVYSSAVDALVIGRLLLMKDHWLLRVEDPGSPV